MGLSSNGVCRHYEDKAGRRRVQGGKRLKETQEYPLKFCRIVSKWHTKSIESRYGLAQILNDWWFVISSRIYTHDVSSARYWHLPRKKDPANWRNWWKKLQSLTLEQGLQLGPQVYLIMFNMCIYAYRLLIQAPEPLNWKHADLVPIYDFLKSAVENGTFKPIFPLEHPGVDADPDNWYRILGLK